MYIYRHNSKINAYVIIFINYIATVHIYITYSFLIKVLSTTFFLKINNNKYYFTLESIITNVPRNITKLNMLFGL